MENIKEKNTESKLLQFPDYLISNFIFPYLTNNELFLTLRTVHPYINEIIKETLGNNYKEEMKRKLINEKEELIKEYENKINYLVNLRNLLIFSNMNVNILEMIKLSVDYLENDNVLKLIIIFTEIFFEEDLMQTLTDDNIIIENKKNILLEILAKEETIQEYLLRLTLILDLNNDAENALFIGLKIMFSEIEDDNVDNINRSCSLINSFLQNLFHFQELKNSANNIKIKIDDMRKKS